LREIIHLRLALESFTTAALEICCVWCVAKEVGLARVRPYLVRSYAPGSRVGGEVKGLPLTLEL